MENIANLMNANKPTAATNPVVYPSWRTISVPSAPDYMMGTQKNCNSYGSLPLSDPQYAPFVTERSSLLKTIGADFTAKKIPCFYFDDADQTYKKVPNDNFIQNDKTGAIIGKHVSDVYGIIDYDTALGYFLTLVDTLKTKGYEGTPTYGAVFDEGARMFVQYKLSEYEMDGEMIESYLSLITSHDKSVGFCLAVSMVLARSQLQIHRCFNGCPNKIYLKHTNGNVNRVDAEAERIIEIEKQQHEKMENYFNVLKSIPANEADMFKVMAKIYDLPSMDTQMKVDNFSRKVGQLFACYRQPSIDSYKNTALGAYLAYADMEQHTRPIRQTKSTTFIDNGINGNQNLSEFVDMLTSMVMAKQTPQATV